MGLPCLPGLKPFRPRLGLPNGLALGLFFLFLGMPDIMLGLRPAEGEVAVVSPTLVHALLLSPTLVLVALAGRVAWTPVGSRWNALVPPPPPTKVPPTKLLSSRSGEG